MQFVLIRGTFFGYCTRPAPKRWRTPMREAVTRHRFRRLPDRRFMEREILAWLAREGWPHLLSIGCRSYTVHYEAMLKRKGVR